MSLQKEEPEDQPVVRGRDSGLQSSLTLCMWGWGWSFTTPSQISEVFFCLFVFNLFVLAILCGMWDLSSLNRDQTSAPCIGSRVSISEVPRGLYEYPL